MNSFSPQIMQMNDQEYWAYQEKCTELATLLSNAIDYMMHHIFEGRCLDPQQWESLFLALNQAVMMKEYLGRNCANLINIAQEFLDQLTAWKQEMGERLN